MVLVKFTLPPAQPAGLLSLPLAGGPQVRYRSGYPKPVSVSEDGPFTEQAAEFPSLSGTTRSGTDPPQSVRPAVGWPGSGPRSAVDGLFSTPDCSGSLAVCFVPCSGGSRSRGTVSDAHPGCSCWGGRCPPPGSSSSATGLGRLWYVDSAAFSGIMTNAEGKSSYCPVCFSTSHAPCSLALPHATQLLCPSRACVWGDGCTRLRS